MTMRLMVAAASLAALCACGSKNQTANSSTGNSSAPAASSGGLGGGSTSSGGASTGSGGNAAASATGGATPGMPANSGELAAQLQQAVTAMRPQLPMHQQTPAGPLTISNIEANGTELVFTMELPTDIDQDKFRQFEQALPAQACGNAMARQMFAMGGSYTYHLKDSTGEEFSTTIRSC